MDTCLFTGTALDANTRIEHTILDTLGGRVKSRRVTSSAFNEQCSSTIDVVAKQIYWPVMTELAPALPSSVRAGGIGVTTPNHVGTYRVDKMGQFHIVGVEVIKDEQGKVKHIIGPDEASIRRVSQSLGLPFKNIQKIDPDHKDIFFGAIPSVNPKIEVCFLKCILLTFDELLYHDDERFTRLPELEDARELVRQFVEEKLESGDNTRLIDISMGLQYESEYRGRYEAIVAQTRLKVNPFNHVLIVSGDPVTKTLDAVFIAFGEDPHAYRLCGQWTGFAKTYVMTNGVLSGEAYSQAAVLNDGWTLGVPNNRRSLIRFNDEQCEPDMESIGDEIATHRFQIITNAIVYRQMHCDESVREQIARSADSSWNKSKSISFAIFDRLLVLFDADNLPPNKADLLIDTVGPILDKAPKDRIDTESDKPASGWTFWIELHRKCITELRQSLGDPGRVYIHRREIRRGQPIKL